MHANQVQSHLILSDPMGCSLPGSLSLGFSRQEYWSGLTCPPPGGSSLPGNQTHISYVSCTDTRVLYHQCHLASTPWMKGNPQIKSKEKKMEFFLQSRWIPQFLTFSSTKSNQKIELQNKATFQALHNVHHMTSLLTEWKKKSAEYYHCHAFLLGVIFLTPIQGRKIIPYWSLIE